MHCPAILSPDTGALKSWGGGGGGRDLNFERNLAHEAFEVIIIFIAQTSDFSVLLLSCQLHETGDFWAGFHVTLKIVCSGFLIGIQFSMGRGTLGITAFFMGTPGIPL